MNNSLSISLVFIQNNHVIYELNRLAFDLNKPSNKQNQIHFYQESEKIKSSFFH